MKTIVLKKNHLTKNGNYLEQYLGFLGIAPEDVDAFIRGPRKSDYEPEENLYNIDKAAEVYYTTLSGKENAKVFVQVDSDTDGYTSSAEIIAYTKRRFPKAEVKWRLHNGKEHGVIVDTVPKDTDLVIIPDAGSNQFAEQAALNEAGIKVIILDHHEVEDFNMKNFNDTSAIIVNNQTSPNFKNKSLSGAGVVYKFMKYMDKHYFAEEKGIADDYLDLASIGIIGDAMNMCNLDNNWITWNGLSCIKNKLICAIGKRQNKIKNPYSLTKMDVMWYIAPVINGTIRSGKPEDKEAVFSAMIDYDGENRKFEHSWRNNVSYENTYERAVRLAFNAKSRQDNGKKKSLEWLKEYVKDRRLNQNNIIIVTLDDKDSNKISATVTGLIAMDLVKEFNKPVLVLRKTILDDKDVYGGSGRNGKFFNLPDFKAELHNAGVFYAEGHGNAFGAFLLPEQVDSITEYFNTHLDAKDFLDEVFEVDYWFHTGETIDKDMLMNFAQTSYLYGNSIPAPSFAFDMNICKGDFFIMGKEQSSLKINAGGISFVSFDALGIISALEDHFAQTADPIHLQIVGKPSLNEWQGRVFVQIMIDDIEITEISTAQNGTVDLMSLI